MLRERTVPTPGVEFTVAPRGFQRGQGQHPLGRPTHPLVFAACRYRPVAGAWCPQVRGAGAWCQTLFLVSKTARKNQGRVGKRRPAGSIELRVSPSPSKIPYGGFSPV